MCGRLQPYVWEAAALSVGTVSTNTASLPLTRWPRRACVSRDAKRESEARGCSLGRGAKRSCIVHYVMHYIVHYIVHYMVHCVAAAWAEAPVAPA